VIYGGRTVDVEDFEPAIEMTLGVLPNPDPEGRGLGFPIAHQGRTKT